MYDASCQHAIFAYKFTGKERDSESGLDNFGARFDSSSTGRFLSPDPLLNSGHPWEPQSWNRYSYVHNNPIIYTDPFGLFRWNKSCDELNDFVCHEQRQRFRDALAKLKNADLLLERGSKERKTLDKILRRIGEEDKGDVKIAFGDAGSNKNGVPNLGRTLGNTITINWDAVDVETTTFGMTLGSLLPSSAIDAALVGHEGGHLSPVGFPVLSLMEHTERSGLYSESATYQGLSTTDIITQLWNRSWAVVDLTARENLRNTAIQKELDRQKGKDQTKQ